MKVMVNNELKDMKTVWFEPFSDVVMIDQTKLPFKFITRRVSNYRDSIDAIRNMIVRGAPAIGATGAFATAQAALGYRGAGTEFFAYMQKAGEQIKTARPTAVDLAHGVDLVLAAVKGATDVELAQKLAVAAAQKVSDDYVENCRKIGEYGNALIKDDSRILTHCNAGWLAAVDWGTALAPIYFAKRSGKKVFVWVDETRPRLQGARLTAWELSQECVEHAIIPDNAAGYYMKKGEVDLCIVGADRVARNGDTANKIGTYEKAVLAHVNKVPFYVAIPSNTYDYGCKTGAGIPIEERSEEEVTYVMSDLGKARIANPKSHAKNPAFDVTPAKYITGYITEKGIFKANELGKKLF